MGLNPFALKEILKEEVVNNRLRTPPGPLKIGDKVIDLQELLGSLQISPDQKRWLVGMPEEPAQKDIVLFLGCSVRYQPDKGLALIELMETAGMDYVAIQGGELCCGGKYVRDGDIDQGNLVAGKLISSLLAFRPLKVICSCSSCYKRVGEIIDHLDQKPFQLQHASVLLSENIHGLKFSNRIEKTVTLHDPCDLRWKSGDTDAVRRLICAIPGVTFKEMRHNRESSLCCGIGSHDKDKQISKELRKRALDEAEETGAHIFATVCTGCHNHFCRVQNSYSFEIIHYMSLLAAAVGHPFEDKIKKYLQFETINEIMEDAAEFIEKSPYSKQEFKKVLPFFFRSAKP
jgi:Fe-S oxidoreductase